MRTGISILRVCSPAVMVAALLISGRAQRADPKDPKNTELGAELIRKTIEARGGDRYLSIKTITATGQYTPFDKGVSQIPAQFLDIIVYPDKERVEFGKGKKKNRRIQVNTGRTGWIYDGDAETLKDQTDKQIGNHLEGLDYDLDRILRGGWKEPGVETRYYGREEIRPGERADVISIQLRPGSPEQIAYLWLDRSTHLPMSLIYEKTGEDGLVKRELRFFQYIAYEGINFPHIVDFYRNGVQESRVNYQTIKIDAPVGDELFAKPASVKAIK